MEKIDITAPFWIKLHPRGIQLLTDYCESFGRLKPEFPTRILASFTQQDGWYEFTIVDLGRVFGNKMADGSEAIILNNEIHLIKPF